MDKADLIGEVCDSLSLGDARRAKDLARAHYPFQTVQPSRRHYTAYQSICVFIRDGFIDRYSGKRLIFPATLRLLSIVMPDEFPAHPNWKMSASHIAYWELFPTIDHLIPIARGGADSEANWVTTSMLRNGAKAQWTIEELGWNLLPAGDIGQWDGLMNWYLSFVTANPKWLETAYLRRWHRAALRARDQCQLD